MNRKQKNMLIRILISLALVILLKVVRIDESLQFYLWLVPYFMIGYDVLWKAIRNIFRGRIFDENFLMSIATVGAIFLKEYTEAAGVMLFYQVGELFQSYAVGKSRRSISQLMDIRPDYANIEKNGEIVRVDPQILNVGDIIIVKPGEKIPVDGVVTEGTSMIDTSALTGESVPRGCKQGTDVISGCVNISGVIKVRVGKMFTESTVSKILDLVENASSKKAKAEDFITKFARYYTPCVVLGALLLAVLPPLFFDGQWLEWLQRALIFLVISCPCALVISIPLSFFGGIGGASKCGILVKGGNYLEALSKTDIIVFDKTGTLTEGTFEVTKICPKNVSKEKLLQIAALAESYSGHPISRSLKNAYKKEIDKNLVKDVREVPGKGINAVIEGKTVLVGNNKLMEDFGINCEGGIKTSGTVVHVAFDNIYTGYIIISDKVKPGTREVIDGLKKSGVRKTVMLTGDVKASGEYTASLLGIDEVYSELLPEDKVSRVEELLAQKLPDRNLVFVGDGVNDAPVLSRADIGIAMGAMGSDAAIEAADIVLMDDSIGKISTAIKISRKTLRIVRQNIFIALFVKAVCLLLGALGLVGMWAAVFADVGVAVIAILNSFRALRTENLTKERS